MNLISKQKWQKNAVCEQLKKTPIVQIACEKVGLSRASYYRWRKTDKKFAEEADKSSCEGILLINDLAESKLISMIHDKNPTAIIFWLKNRHRDYAQKLEITAKHEDHKLTPEQRKMVKQALKLGALLPEPESEQNNSLT